MVSVRKLPPSRNKNRLERHGEPLLRLDCLNFTGLSPRRNRRSAGATNRRPDPLSVTVFVNVWNYCMYEVLRRVLKLTSVSSCLRRSCRLV
jgi:hypothetical protein